MGNTLSITVPSAATSSTAPVDPKLPTQNIQVTPTANGGVQVTNVAEPTAAPVVTPDPSLILGKFKTQAELEAAYTELQGKLGKPKEGEAAPVVTPEASALNIASATKVLTDKGLDYNEFANQYAKDGSLSSESYSKLFAKGITAQQIDAFIAQQAPIIAAAKAEVDVKAKDVKDHVGGEAEFAKLIDFVAKTLTPAEIASYNRAVDAGDTLAAKLLLTNFKAQRDAKLGVEPNLNGGNPPNTAVSSTYRDLGQYHAELRDPRYESDDHFRKKVTEKLTRSKHLYT